MSTHTAKEVFEYLRNSRCIKTQTEFAEKLEWSRGYASQIISGSRVPPKNFKEQLDLAFPGVELANIVSEENTDYSKQGSSSARIINRKKDATRQPYTNKHGVRFEPLTDGDWLITYKHVPPAAHAAYTAGWGDPEYIESLPERTTVVSEVSEDNYLSFTVTGHCQDDGSIDGAPENMELTGRSYPRAMWQYKLPFAPVGGEKKLPKIKVGDKEIDVPTKGKRYRYWLIVDRYKGIQVATIKSQDLQKGILHCACRNPDKKKHPDFDIKLDECSQIFFVIARRINE